MITAYCHRYDNGMEYTRCGLKASGFLNSRKNIKSNKISNTVYRAL
jgi:hypothetical protein